MSTFNPEKIPETVPADTLASTTDMNTESSTIFSGPCLGNITPSQSSLNEDQHSEQPSTHLAIVGTSPDTNVCASDRGDQAVDGHQHGDIVITPSNSDMHLDEQPGDAAQEVEETPSDRDGLDVEGTIVYPSASYKHQQDLSNTSQLDSDDGLARIYQHQEDLDNDSQPSTESIHSDTPQDTETEPEFAVSDTLNAKILEASPHHSHPPLNPQSTEQESAQDPQDPTGDSRQVLGLELSQDTVFLDDMKNDSPLEDTNVSQEPDSLPSSSPPLDQASSPPPTSSPRVFTSSPLQSSQSSLQRVPDLKLDRVDDVNQALSSQDRPSNSISENSFEPFDEHSSLAAHLYPPSSSPIVSASLSITAQEHELPSSPVSAPKSIDSLPSPVSSPFSRIQGQDLNHSSSSRSSTSIVMEVEHSTPESVDISATDSLPLTTPDVDVVSPPYLQMEPELVDQNLFRNQASARSDMQKELPDTNPSLEAPRLAKYPTVPTPKRATFTSQSKALKKLATPFRSPFMKDVKGEFDRSTPPPPPAAAANITTAMAIQARPSPLSELQRFQEKEKEKEKEMVIATDKNKHRTVRASAQFKSPLTATAAASAGNSSIRLTPSIQMLERKVQLLKRAVKVRKDQEEEVLKHLIRTWTEAGREVAYELFDLAKDRETSGVGVGGVRKFEDSWGWNSQDATKRLKVEDQGSTWGWDTSASPEGNFEDREPMEVIDVDEEMPQANDDEEEEKSEHTIGTMLRQLGVDPLILGWDDNEGTFVDK